MFLFAVPRFVSTFEIDDLLSEISFLSEATFEDRESLFVLILFYKAL